MKGSKRRKDLGYLLGGVFVEKDYKLVVEDYEIVKEIPDIKENAVENLNIFMIKADKLSELCSNAENLSYNYHKFFIKYPFWDFRTMKLVKP
jgi:hypothetical protein